MPKDPALKGRYLIYNPIANFGLTLIDFSLDKTIGRLIKKNGPISKPKKILISNIAHLGDLILTTSILKPLKDSFPDCEIGFLLGSWSKTICEGHPSISHLHTVDHWKNNRDTQPLHKKVKQHYSTKKKALQEIKEIGYDIAVDLNFHFPGSAPLFFQAKIPTRIGYNTSGFSSFYTHPLPWQSHSTYSVGDYFQNLLSLIPGYKKSKLHPQLPSINLSLFDNLKNRFGISPKNYLVIHMGASASHKEWPHEKWIALSQLLLNDGHFLLFTGKGERERKNIEQLTQKYPHQTLSLADSLTWNDWISLIANASLLIGVDSCAGHIAAATDTPSLLLYNGQYPQSLWAPLSDKSTLLTQQLPCCPCWNRMRCESMDCLREIDVDEVYEAARRVIRI